MEFYSEYRLSFITMTSLLWRHLYTEHSQSVQYLAYQSAFSVPSVYDPIKLTAGTRIKFPTKRIFPIFHTFYPRDAMLARVFATATCLSVRLSGRPSVKRRYCA